MTKLTPEEIAQRRALYRELYPPKPAKAVPAMLRRQQKAAAQKKVVIFKDRLDSMSRWDSP